MKNFLLLKKKSPVKKFPAWISDHSKLFESRGYETEDRLAIVDRNDERHLLIKKMNYQERPK